MTKALLIAATGSAKGKTSLTLGLLAALRRRGLRVAPFKTGPDFIDPGLHQLACGAASHTLDSWMLSETVNREILARYAQSADVVVVEGAMGLFDGISGTDEAGSAAHMAKLLGLPVLLVIDASGMARSAAAVAQGFAGFDPALALAGVVFNRVASPNHREILAEAMAGTGIPVLGYLSRNADIALPSRHLGLVTAGDLEVSKGGPTGPDVPNWLDHLAAWVEAGIDLNSLLAALPACGLAVPVGRVPAAPAVPLMRLGVSRDRAFCFCYGENLRLLQEAGAELVFFSPLDDACLPEGLDGLYLVGGYPELHARQLSGNAGMLATVRAFCASGRPVYAECGGFMYLMEAFVDREGGEWPMAGVFSCRARMGERFAALGYREVVFRQETLLGPVGTAARGHEFHYSRLGACPSAQAVYAVSGRKGAFDIQEGFLAGNVLASYIHLHFGSSPRLAANFVTAMAQARGLAAS